MQNYKALKEKHRLIREKHSDNLNLRIHRALSWLKRAEELGEDKDLKFVCLWVSFNAAYAHEISDLELSEIQHFSLFLEKICQLDQDKRLYQAIWAKFSHSIRILLDNHYVYQPFWNDYRQGKTEWKEKFLAQKRVINTALANQETCKILSITFSRLYTLRNQIVHGGATWNGSVNRDQLRDAINLMQYFVPLVIDIMMDNPEELWGEPHYPVVKD
ncbi:hypothetical protein CEP45_04760 [Mergibacter septicus]|uniref:HEPN domain-containing protein n=1 Tax=Mergibacter septicus TaxID=221402 RepID=UPI001C79643B|nr:HEPN domain-containing protein [Mergibacter septicus]QDJ13200.1 hypothetical protein CEP45_04760 [Mergibacter septicus]